jgi:hypothetical protein
MVKTYYGPQKILLQILFLEIMQLSISTKPMLKEFFINYTQNKVVQLPNNVIVIGNYILKLILNDSNNYKT